MNESSLKQVSDVEIQRRYNLIEERLKAIKGDDIYEVVDATELSLVPDLVILPKFKVPNFAKYSGASCPSMHLRVYCMKMMGYTDNEKLLIHFF